MTAERVYSVLLALYPQAFRREYGDAMVEAFRDLRRQRDRAPVSFWLLVVVDTGRAAGLLHMEAWRSGPRRFAVQWVMACGLGATICGALGSAVTWSFSYLYHPYLEGLTFIPWMYGAMLGAGLGIVQSAALRGRLRLGAGWILASATCGAVGLETAMAVAHLTGPFGYSIVFGSVVASGQWLVLHSHIRRAGWWVLPSAAALSAALISSSAALNRALTGMNPLRIDVLDVPTRGPSFGIDLLLRGLYAPTSWTEFTLGFAVMAATGLVIGAVTAKRVSSMLSRAQ